MKVTTAIEQYWLDHHISKFMDRDLFDDHEIDQSLTYYEKKRIITEKYRIFLSPQEQIEAGLYTAEDARNDMELIALEEKGHPPIISRPLTIKQRRVLDLLLEDHSQRETGRMLGIARETVKKHFMAIKKKGYAIKIGYNKYRYINPDEVSTED